MDPGRARSDRPSRTLSTATEEARTKAGIRPAEPLRRALSRRMLTTVGQYGLLKEGDRVGVGISGGKDSYALLDLLSRARKKAPVRFELVAIHVDQGLPSFNVEPVRRWLETCGEPFEVVREDTWSIVQKLAAEDAAKGRQRSPCAPCSRLRRGILYNAAERLGCNKLALGHHREDVLETFLMNLLYSGRLQAMPASYRTDCGRFEVIRPFVHCAEADIAEYARQMAFPLVHAQCVFDDRSQREATGRLIESLEARIPDVRTVMLAALANVTPTHLLDRELNAALACLKTPARYTTDTDDEPAFELPSPRP